VAVAFDPAPRLARSLERAQPSAVDGRAPFLAALARDGSSDRRAAPTRPALVAGRRSARRVPDVLRPRGSSTRTRRHCAAALATGSRSFAVDVPARERWRAEHAAHPARCRTRARAVRTIRRRAPGARMADLRLRWRAFLARRAAAGRMAQSRVGAWRRDSLAVSGQARLCLDQRQRARKRRVEGRARPLRRSHRPRPGCGPRIALPGVGRTAARRAAVALAARGNFPRCPPAARHHRPGEVVGRSARAETRRSGSAGLSAHRSRGGALGRQGVAGKSFRTWMERDGHRDSRKPRLRIRDLGRIPGPEGVPLSRRPLATGGDPRRPLRSGFRLPLPWPGRNFSTGPVCPIRAWHPCPRGAPAGRQANALRQARQAPGSRARSARRRPGSPCWQAFPCLPHCSSRSGAGPWIQPEMLRDGPCVRPSESAYAKLLW